MSATPMSTTLGGADFVEVSDPSPLYEESKVELHRFADSALEHLGTDPSISASFQRISETESDPIETSESEPPQGIGKSLSTEDIKHIIQQQLLGVSASKPQESIALEAELLEDRNDPRQIVLRHYFSQDHFPGPASLVRKCQKLTRVEAQDIIKKAMDELSKLESAKKFAFTDESGKTREFEIRGSYDDRTVNVKGHQRAEERALDPRRFEKSDTNHYISAREVLEHKPAWFDPTANLRDIAQSRTSTNKAFKSKIETLERSAKDATKDPFDSVYFPSANFSGVDKFDSAHGHINDSQVDPRNPYSKLSYLQEDILNVGEVVAVVPSDAGKFRSILFNDTLNNNVMTLGHIERLKFHLKEYSKDRKTIGLGICSRSKRELCGPYDFKGLWNAHHSGIHNHASQYYESIYTTIHALIYHPKVTLAMLSGRLEGPAAGLAMHAECRLGHAGARLYFNQCQLGSTLDCGSTWRLVNMGTGWSSDTVEEGYRKSTVKMLSFYFALTGRPASMWDMMELNLCDWAWPNENGPFAFGRIGAEIDQKLRDLFWDQDKYHVRTNFKSVVELYDRGLEFFRSPLLAGKQGSQVNDLMQPFMNALFPSWPSKADPKEEIRVGAKNDQVLNALKLLESTLKQKCKDEDLGFEAQKMLEGLQNASPMSLWATTMLMLRCWQMNETRFPSNRDHKTENEKTLMEEFVLKNPANRNDFLPTTFLKMEYRVLMWLMKRGDYWDRVRGKAFSRNGKCMDEETSKPQTITDLEDFLKHTENGKQCIQELEDVLSYPRTAQCQTDPPAKPIGNILKNSQIYDLELPHIPLRDTLVHPEFTLPGLSWKGTQHYDEQLEKQFHFHYDYAMLRGPSHPDMDLILHRRQEGWRKNLIRQGVTKFESLAGEKVHAETQKSKFRYSHDSY